MHKIRHVLFHVFFNIFFVFAEEKKHDAMMLVDFNLLQGLERYRFSPNGQPMSVFGDPAYPLRVHLQAPFRRGILVPEMEQYNAAMSSVRVSVEWLFGDIYTILTYIEITYKENTNFLGKITWVRNISI